MPVLVAGAVELGASVVVVVSVTVAPLPEAVVVEVVV